MNKACFTSVIEDLESNVWHFHIKVPSHIADPFVKSGNKRVVCKIEPDIEFQCALMPAGEEGWFINVNKEKRKQLQARLGTELNISLETDTSEYGLPLPPELEELFNQDDEGKRVFHSLTKGKQRNLLYIVGKPKSSDIRLRKAITILDYLKFTGGKLDFKELNEALKVKK
jgi:hypothetical protein